MDNSGGHSGDGNVAAIPPIEKLSDSSSVNQLWYADEATSGSCLADLMYWWDLLKFRLMVFPKCKEEYSLSEGF